MIILIPLGGIGLRFKSMGYREPKALIKVFGIPILYYLLKNLNHNNNLIYIPYNIEYDKYNFESLLKKDFPSINFKFYKINFNTEGALHTINIALQEIFKKVEDQPIICLDGDNFYNIDIIEKWDKKNQVFVTEINHNINSYSYVLAKENIIIDIKEKDKISNLACTGAYCFESYYQLYNLSNQILKNNIKQKNEFYTSGVIKLMIEQGNIFTTNIINKKDWICLGTPLQVRLFLNNYPQNTCINKKINIKKLRICFDLDNTLVTFPEIQNDYTTVKPINNMINYLKYLKKFGHTIIIYTARKMKTHQGNNGKVLADVGKITFDTLEKFNIPYDEIYFGKPYADYYIDDLAINSFDNIEYNIGFYDDKINARDFNEIIDNFETIIKKGKNLTGEIYYYQNIPNEIKDLFPILLDVSENYYVLEKINGLTVTQLYLSELLKEDTLKHIMNSIRRIHSCGINDDQNINIYDNYSKKVTERFNSFDYSKFENSLNIYNDIIKNLYDYERNNKGKKTVIHGDTVMTNILINEFEKIKFIDMRGKINDQLTIYGDHLYDWAKLLQSLVGYDKILQSKEINKNYEEKMINIFKNYILENYSLEDLNNIILITKSLLFSLIPLHNNEKCIEYYNLITKIDSII